MQRVFVSDAQTNSFHSSTRQNKINLCTGVRYWRLQILHCNTCSVTNKYGLHKTSIRWTSMASNTLGRVSHQAVCQYFIKIHVYGFCKPVPLICTASSLLFAQQNILYLSQRLNSDPALYRKQNVPLSFDVFQGLLRWITL